ncbi:hypothetical protein IV203_029473 [Nitzschia inconspicua]|uniref:Uncharacterized protein n=1 Tax=Nitzschia inconspicua TaxID=303405 RepID=A0A9K3LQS8_9STRA|nr:hypothetical protein IV203_029473 [Nitzschia inconspicua]
MSSPDSVHRFFLRSVLMASKERQRELAFLNTLHDDEYVNEFDGSVQDTLLLTFYSLLALCYCVMAYFTIRLVRNTKEFHQYVALSYGLPAVSLYMALECATLALDEALPTIPSVWGGLLYILEAMVVAPGLFLSTFTVTFVAYRIRSLPFCCVRRRRVVQEGMVDVSPSDEETLVQPALLVLAMHCFAVLLFVINILVNFDVLWSDAGLAGRTGWMTLLLDPWEPSFFRVVLALVPMTLVCGVCLYFAYLLFRYGNEYSMTIYISFVTPWMWPLVGVAALVGGFLPPSPWFPLASNLGIGIYQVTILRVMFEIRLDLGQANELGSYLQACWETPNGVDVASTEGGEGISEPPTPSLPADRAGILRQSATSSNKVNEIAQPPQLQDAKLL